MSFSRQHELENDLEAVIEGHGRLTVEQAMRVYREASLHDLSRWSTRVAQRMHGPMGSPRTYVIDRNINYTNVCSAHCTFCAFRRDEGDADAYVLNREAMRAKLQELVDIGGTQVLLQGGMHPGLGLDFYVAMLSGMKQDFPQVHLHAFSPPELVEFVAVLDLPGFASTPAKQSHTLPREVWLAKLEAVMRRLMDAGLASVPGGGAEIFGEHVRRRIGVGKATSEQWLDVMRTAHRLGLNTSATMMFGHIEGVADRIDHMDRLRRAQDEAIEKGWGGRCMAFIAWPFQRDHTPLGDLPDYDAASGEAFAGDALADLVAAGEVDPEDKKACGQAVPRAGKILRTAGASEYLRMQAISRLFLDNFHSVGSSWVTMGPHVGQLALSYGASDMGSVMMEENVVSSAGTTYCLNEAVLCRLIRDAGYVPAQRDNAYRVLKEHRAGGPDLEVRDWSTQRVSRLSAQVEDAALVETPSHAGAGAVSLTVAGQ